MTSVASKPISVCYSNRNEVKAQQTQSVVRLTALGPTTRRTGAGRGGKVQTATKVRDGEMRVEETCRTKGPQRNLGERG
jgi:hypothetical protein